MYLFSALKDAIFSGRRSSVGAESPRFSESNRVRRSSTQSFNWQQGQGMDVDQTGSARQTLARADSGRIRSSSQEPVMRPRSMGGLERDSDASSRLSTKRAEADKPELSEREAPKRRRTLGGSTREFGLISTRPEAPMLPTGLRLPSPLPRHSMPDSRGSPLLSISRPQTPSRQPRFVDLLRPDPAQQRAVEVARSVIDTLDRVTATSGASRSSRRYVPPQPLRPMRFKSLSSSRPVSLHDMLSGAVRSVPSTPHTPSVQQRLSPVSLPVTALAGSPRHGLSAPSPKRSLEPSIPESPKRIQLSSARQPSPLKRQPSPLKKPAAAPVPAGTFIWGDPSKVSDADFIEDDGFAPGADDSSDSETEEPKTTNIFGGKDVASIFSKTAGELGQTGGKPVIGDQPVSSIFGVPGSTQDKPVSIFGAPPSDKAKEGSIFGTTGEKPKEVSIFGTIDEKPKETSIFGATTSEKPKEATLFGATAEKPKETSIFGASTGEKPKEVSIFGSTAAEKPESVSSLFGSSTTKDPPTEKPKVFGGSSASEDKAKETSIFGAPPAEKPKEVVSIFGSTSNTAVPGSLFGGEKPKEVSLFGTPADRGTGPKSTESSIFGSAVEQPSLFGAAPVEQSTNIFGASATKPAEQTSNIFGASASKPADQTSNIFGGSAPKPAEQPTSIFGASTPKPAEQPTNIFGASAPKPAEQATNIFGASTGASTGQPTQQAGNIFGASTGVPTSNVFGSTSEKRPEPLSLFGSTGTGNDTVTFGGLSGAPADQSKNLPTSFATSNIFGAQPAAGTPKSNMFVFGATPPASPHQNVFGQTAQPQQPSLFGQQPGTPSNSLFGAAAPTPTGNSIFGNAAPGGMFSAGSATDQSAGAFSFGQAVGTPTGSMAGDNPFAAGAGDFGGQGAPKRKIFKAARRT